VHEMFNGFRFSSPITANHICVLDNQLFFQPRDMPGGELPPTVTLD
jgi:hypothetical protein